MKYCTKANDTSPQCTGEHDLKSCSVQFKKCVNCVEVNKKRKNLVPTDHSCFEQNKCYAYNTQIQLRKSKIDYGLD
jgi:hypothetical protein